MVTFSITCPWGAVHCCQDIPAIVPENFAWLSATLHQELLQLHFWYSASSVPLSLVDSRTLCSWGNPRGKSHRRWGRGILEAIQRPLFVRLLYQGTIHWRVTIGMLAVCAVAPSCWNYKLCVFNITLTQRYFGYKQYFKTVRYFCHTLYKTLMGSMLVYGGENWIMTKKKWNQCWIGLKGQYWEGSMDQ